MFFEVLDVFGGFMMFFEDVEYFDVLGCFKMFWDILGHFGTFLGHF